MVALVPLLLSSLLACWAPTVAPVGDDAPDPVPEPEEHGPGPAPDAPQPPPAEVGAPPDVGSPRPTPRAVPPAVWSSAELPEAPFTAWTARAPLTLVGPGGVTVEVVRRVGVRVEVLQVLDGRMRVRCEGCEGGSPGTGPEGWLPLDAVRAADDHGEPDDALSALLRQRAAWAGGRGLPEGVGASPLCELVDRGFALPPGGRVLEELVLDAGDEIRASFSWEEGAWTLVEISGVPTQGAWTCRTTRPSQRGRGPAPR